MSVIVSRVLVCRVSKCVCKSEQSRHEIPLCMSVSESVVHKSCISKTVCSGKRSINALRSLGNTVFSFFLSFNELTQIVHSLGNEKEERSKWRWTVYDSFRAEAKTKSVQY
jgi:hypothetical protein